MLIVEIFNSLTDVNGNRYFAIRVDNRSTGKQAVGTICGDDSNVSSALRELFGGYEEARQYSHSYRTSRKIREFNRETKKATYAGCTADEINSWIVANVGPVAGAVQPA